MKLKGFRSWAVRFVVVCVSTCFALPLTALVLRSARNPEHLYPHHKDRVSVFYPTEEITPSVEGVSYLMSNEFGCRVLTEEEKKRLWIGARNEGDGEQLESFVDTYNETLAANAARQQDDLSILLVGKRDLHYDDVYFNE